MEIFKLIQEKKCIILLNKTDLESKITEKDLENIQSKNTVIMKISAKENVGINEFENKIKDMFFHNDIHMNDELIITNMRHKEALIDSYESLKQVIKSIDDNMPEDFYSIDLMSAYSSLGFIIGEEIGDDLVNEIFSKFCMGK